jgi:hypothetical protein
MSNTFLSTWLLVALVLLAARTLAADSEAPEGWFKAGSHPNDYDMGADTTAHHGGKASGFIKAKEDPKGFGTLMQMFRADNYRGKRLRLSGYVKSDQIDDWAGLWMRIDGKTKTLGFDNMEERAIKGTTDWKKYEIVLDVPKESVNIAFGILLQGKGQAWVDDFQFEVVGKDVPVTHEPFEADPFDKETEPVDQKEPVNLDFEK